MEETVKNLEKQPAPKAADGPHIVDIVINELHTRKLHGLDKYGVPLQAHNGRSALQDAYEEASDLTLYLRQALEEERSIEQRLMEEREKIAAYVGSRGDRLSDENWNLAEFVTDLASEIRAGAYRDTVRAPPPVHVEDDDSAPHNNQETT
jgi:hypothetical protein